MMQPQDFHKIIDGIDRALSTFECTSNHAVMRLYRQSTFAPKSKEKAHISSQEGDPLLAESEHEHVFLVYLSVSVPLVFGHHTDVTAQLHFHASGVRRGVDVPY